MTNNVKVIKSGSWADQAEQNWCFKYKPNHARPERYRWKNVQEKTTTTKTIKRQVLVHAQNEWVVFFGYIWPGMGAKAHRSNMSPPDRNRHPYKRPPTNSFCSHSFISAMSPFLLTTPGHPSHHLFTCFHRSLPVGRIQHHTRQQCLLLCVILSSTRDGVMIQYDSVYISVSTSPSYKISYFLHLDIPLNISSHAFIVVCL